MITINPSVCVQRDIAYNYGNIREFTPFSVRENKHRKSIAPLRWIVFAPNKIVEYEVFLSSLTADVQQRALLPPSAALSNTSQNLNQDQSSEEDVFDDTDSDEENSKKQLPSSMKKSSKTKTISKPLFDDPNQSALQIKRLLSTIFPTTKDVYGFFLDEPSAESLECYEQYAKIARDACLVSPPAAEKQQQHEVSSPRARSASSTSSFEMSVSFFPHLSRLDSTPVPLSSVLPTSVERSTSVEHKIQQQREHQTLLASLTVLFDEPRVSADTLRIYENCVAVAQQGSFEPSDADRQVYEDYVASLMINVQS